MTADTCPKCGSCNTARRSQKITDFLAGELAVCGDCSAAWEPIDTANLTIPDHLFSPFRKPCDNCAFRPGSSERRKKRSWRQLIGKLTSDPYTRFDCHKGVPIWIGNGEGPKGTKSNIGFDYASCQRRPCAGWQALQRGAFAKALRAIREFRDRKPKAETTRRPA